MTEAHPKRPLDDATSRAGTLHLAADALCLDFTNTSSGRHSEDWLDHLTSYRMLSVWAEHAGAIDAATAALLRDKAAAMPRQAEIVLLDAVALREAIYRIFSAVAERGQAGETDLAVLDGAHLRAQRHRHLRAGPSGFALEWRPEGPALDRLLWPVAESAVELLTRGRLDRVKVCPGHHCGWLFLDTTKNGTRRWCSMEVCGNRAKQRAIQARKKAAG
ncbi:MAG TPA: ABATE domain-containing protein [Alphaproteobacteria bacterium]|nr:ABATE domain-containing protein [Alphaproteobacteria bacterium]